MVQFSVILAHCDVMCLDKIRSIKRMCCFYKRIMFSASGKFFCVYTEKNGMKHDEVENFSQLYFQEKRQIGSAAHLEAKIQKKFVKTLLLR